jgi:predicted HAD superfamily Cof-like phosphohydrolase
MEFMLLEFHLAFGATVNTKPTKPSDRDRKMRHALVTEELQETHEALATRDLPEFVDGLIDSLYVLVGSNLTYGFRTVEPIYGHPLTPPAFPAEIGQSILTGMIDGMSHVADLVLDPEKTVPLPVIEMCVNKLIGDCLNILHICGVDAMHAFVEVHLANMRKLGPDGLPMKREDGKVMKPQGWVAPDIQKVIDEQARRFAYPTPAV